jgi:hypothetical protein
MFLNILINFIIAPIIANGYVIPNNCGNIVSSVNNTCDIPNIYTCGPLNTLGQGTVVQCINGFYVHIDDCNDTNTNTCTLINSIPYCVQ